MSESVEQRESVAEVVEEHRETLELAAAGDDDAAELAENILDAAEGSDE